MISKNNRWSDNVWKGFLVVLSLIVGWMFQEILKVTPLANQTQANAEQIDKLWTRTADIFTKDKAFSLQLELQRQIHAIELENAREHERADRQPIILGR